VAWNELSPGSNNVTSKGGSTIMTPGIQRSIFRWIHIILAIPILGYIYSPFDKLPQYAFPTRYVFFPLMVVTGLWMWKGHVVRRLISKGAQRA
jgi:thiosulfate reductase cytochrome b subunit